MATSTFSYATQANFKDYFPHLMGSDNKSPVYNWTTTDTSNQYQANNTGLITQLYFDGIEGTSVTDAPNANYEFNYSDTTDSVQVFLTTSAGATLDPNNILVESGSDFKTFIDNQLYRASMELNNMLDGRFPNPIPKTFIHSDTPSSDNAEYDAILVKLTCYVLAVNMLRSSGDYEQAEIVQNEITNIDRIGMVDKLNAGEYKLAFETDKTDSSGDIIEVTNTGSMNLVETYGEWTGIRYDRVQIICTTAGAYGTAKYSIKTSDSSALYGTTTTGQDVTGGLDYIGNGLYIRFEGNAMAENDRWDIEVRNYALKQTNSQGTRSINSIRNDLQPAKITPRRNRY